MATKGVMLWSTTAGNNATADPTVNWAEGMAPSAVNNSARAEMASVALWRNDISGTLTAGGTSTAYTLTTNATFNAAADMDGALIVFRVGTTNGDNVTLAVDGLTARQIVTASATNVGAGQLIAGQIYAVTYVHSTTEFRLWNAFPIIITGLTAETAVATADVFPFYDDSAGANRKVTLPNLFKGFTVLDAETALATDDQLLISDTSDSSAANRMTVENFLKIVNSLTEDTTPDEANDLLLSYDASASGPKKVKMKNVEVALNYASSTLTANTQFNGTTPNDDTIPQVGEGTEILSVSITPTRTSNKVRIKFSGQVAIGTGGATNIFHLHRDGAANAIFAIQQFMPTADVAEMISFEFIDSPATTSAVTYSLRAGNPSGSQLRFCGDSSSGRLLGGVITNTLTAEQIYV